MAIGLEQGQRTSSRRSLPHSIGALTGLHVLNLSFNQLTTLPDSIAALTGLTELNLCNNELLGRNSHSPAVTTWIARLRQHPGGIMPYWERRAVPYLLAGAATLEKVNV